MSAPKPNRASCRFGLADRDRHALAIAVENIVKRYGDFEAVKGVSFYVAEGEIFGLLGPNGAGKSTLIRMMTTLIPVTAGRAIVGGHDVVKDSDAVRRMIGVIPQAMTSDPDLTVEENLIIYAKLYSVPRAEREKNITEVLEAVDLIKWRDAPTKTLSGGMRRRLEIARGLVHNPRIFFLDEPTTGLDPVSRIAVWEMLNNLKKTAQPHHAPHHPLHGRGRPASATASPSSTTASSSRSARPSSSRTASPGANVVEVQFDRETTEWQSRLEKLPKASPSVQPQSAASIACSPQTARRPPRSSSRWPLRSASSSLRSACRTPRSTTSSSTTPAASFAMSRSRPSSPCRRARERSHEQNVRHCRARDAQVLPLAHAHDHVA